MITIKLADLSDRNPSENLAESTFFDKRALHSLWICSGTKTALVFYTWWGFGTTETLLGLDNNNKNTSWFGGKNTPFHKVKHMLSWCFWEKADVFRAHMRWFWCIANVAGISSSFPPHTTVMFSSHYQGHTECGQVTVKHLTACQYCQLGTGLSLIRSKRHQATSSHWQRHRVRSVFITQHQVIEPRPAETRDAYLTMYSLHRFLPSTQRTLRTESPFQILSTQHKVQQINMSQPNRLTMPFCAAATDVQQSGYLVLNQAIIETAVMTALVNCA